MFAYIYVYYIPGQGYNIITADSGIFWEQRLWEQQLWEQRLFATVCIKYWLPIN